MEVAVGQHGIAKVGPIGAVINHNDLFCLVFRGVCLLFGEMMML